MVQPDTYYSSGFSMIKGYLPLAPLFILAFCIGLVVNFPELSEQKN